MISPHHFTLIELELCEKKCQLLQDPVIGTQM